MYSICRLERSFTLQSPEDPYRTLAERMNEGAATLSADGTILFCNRRLAEMVLTPSERLLGSSFSSLLREDQRGGLEELLQSSVENDVRTESELMRKDGTALPVQLSLSLAALGEAEKVFCLIATDLSELKRAKRGLREQSEIFEQAQDAILICDLDSRIQSWNRGARDLYGWPAEEALGKASFELLHTEFPKRLEAILVSLHAEKEWEGELRQIRRDGKALVVASRWSLLRDERDPCLKSLPVVMLTSSRQGPDLAECYALGVNAYVVKPVESAAFFEAVKTAGRFWAIMNERSEAGKTAEVDNAQVVTK
jgi:two-component system cell cycle sensor histidine kinase/response regulator CckA